MNPIEDGAIVDACTLKNFSVVDRMDVLEAYFSGRARWTEAIAREAGRLGLPSLDWLGPAMSPGDDIAALIGVDEIRRGLGATPPIRQPCISARPRRSTFLSGITRTGLS